METILAGALGVVATWLVAHLYYARSTKDLKRQVETLREKLTSLESATQALRDATEVIQDTSDVIRRHVAAGTPDDPDFPYK